MKKILSFLAALGLSATFIHVSAEVSNISAEYNADEAILTVTGNCDKVCAFMVIVPKNRDKDIPYELADIEEDSVGDKVLVFGEVSTDEIGKFEKKFPMSMTQEDGNYTVFACSNDMTAPKRAAFKYVRKESFDMALDAINTAQPENIVEVLKSYGDVLGLNLINILTQDATEVGANIVFVRPENGFLNPIEIQQGINKGYAITVLNASDSKIALHENIDNFNTDLGLDLELYENIGTSDTRNAKQIKVCEKMLTQLPVLDIKIFNDKLIQAVVETDITAPEDWAYLRDMITKTYRDKLSVSDNTWKKYDKINDASALFKKLYKLDFKSIVDVENAFKEAVDEQPAPDKSSYGGAGGGGKGVSVNLPISENAAITPDSSDKGIFLDIDQAAWAKDDILALRASGILSGDGNGYVFPNRDITREEFVTMIVKALGFETSKEVAFADVAQDAWYANNIASALKKGVISGISETEFGVGMPITRQDMAVIIFRCAEVEYSEGDFSVLPFGDADEIDEYAKIAVAYLNECGIINGMDDNNFEPKKTATRAQAAVVINKFLSLKGDNKDA